MPIKLGDYNVLKIIKRVDFGLYLDGEEAGEILLPQRYVPENAKIAFFGCFFRDSCMKA